MIKWKFKKFVYPEEVLHSTELTLFMNKLGSEGWELHSVTPTGFIKKQYVFIFKCPVRPVSNKVTAK